jgi:hypothetical protein
LWKKYSPLLLTFAAFVVLAVGGLKFYQTQQLKVTQEIAATYEKAIALANANKADEALSALKPLTSQPSQYQDFAKLLEASLKAKANSKEALAAFDVVINDTSVNKDTRDAALLHSAYIMVDTAKAEDIKARLAPLSQTGGTYRLAAQELIGMAAYKAGDVKAAQDIFNALKSDVEASQSLKVRVDIILSVLAGQK